jgi:hypothetical protein
MLFVTVLALHIHRQVDLMFSDLRYTGMASQTVPVAGSYPARLMRLVALIAIELHRRFFVKRDLLGLLDRCGIGRKEPHVQGGIVLQLLPDSIIVAVAVETFKASGLEVLGPVGVTVETGKPSHALAMHLLFGMTFIAELFRGQEAVETTLVGFYVTVTLGTFELLHIHMLGMEEGLIDPHGIALGMALVAVFLAHDNMLFVTLGHHGRTLQNEADQQPVQFFDREVMAIVTVDIFVLAL